MITITMPTSLGIMLSVLIVLDVLARLMSCIQTWMERTSR